MTGFFKGVATALITPFCDDGVGYDALAQIIDDQIAAGVDALVVLGTTGEPSTMTEEEKANVTAFAARQISGRCKLIIGTGGNNTKEAVLATKRAETLGADGVLAVTPYYNKCTQNGLVEYYKAIAKSTSLPVICYNVPARTGVNLLPETMARIAEIPNIAGIKEASGNMAQVLETARLIRGKCDLYSGEDILNLPILAAGGAGVISVVSNLAPHGVKALYEAVKAGDLPRAIVLGDRLLPLVKACFTEVNPIPVKAGMNLLGFAAGEPRAPLTRIEEPHLKELEKAMTEYGLKVVK